MDHDEEARVDRDFLALFVIMCLLMVVGYFAWGTYQVDTPRHEIVEVRCVGGIFFAVLDDGEVQSAHMSNGNPIPCSFEIER